MESDESFSLYTSEESGLQDLHAIAEKKEDEDKKDSGDDTVSNQGVMVFDVDVLDDSSIMQSITSTISSEFGSDEE